MQQSLTFCGAKLPLEMERVCGAEAAYTRKAVPSNLKSSGLINWFLKMPDANQALKSFD